MTEGNGVNGYVGLLQNPSRRRSMNLVFRVLLCVVFAQTAWADTAPLKERRTEIDGTVTFSNGVFQIVALFKRGPRQISIDGDGVSEVRFNNVKDNPDDDAPDWMLHLPTNSVHGQAQGVVRFWDPKEKDITGTLEAVTSDTVTIQGKQSVRKVGIRAVILS
jgi:hypothetical protein